MQHAQLWPEAERLAERCLRGLAGGLHAAGEFVASGAPDAHSKAPARSGFRLGNQLAPAHAAVCDFYQTYLDIDIASIMPLGCVAFDNDLPGACVGIARLTVDEPPRRVSAVSVRLRPARGVLETQATLVHEAFHVLSGHQNYGLPQYMEEGSANLVEYLYLKTIATAHSQHLQQQLLRNTDPIYGDGFREARRIYKTSTGLRHCMQQIITIHAR